MDNPVIVVDVETTMDCPRKGHEANPFWPDNKIVLLGETNVFDNKSVVNILQLKDLTAGVQFPHSQQAMFVAHNAAFDMHYMMRTTHDLRLGSFPVLVPNKFARNNTLWDTQLAEYLLEGQEKPYPSLDYCATKRGGTLKDSFVSDFFKRGEGADKVPEEKLTEYLRNDVENTAIVFKSQFQEALDRGMLPLIMSQMEARLATIDMGWNGIKIDYEFLNKRIGELEVQVALLKSKLIVTSYCAYKDGSSATVYLDLTAPLQLYKVLFGGTHKLEVKELVGKYKNGNDKFAKVVREVGVPALLTEAQCKLFKSNKSVDDSVLHAILSDTLVSSTSASIIYSVLDYRRLNKELTTYFEGLLKATMPDGFVHPNHNHCVTRTGRLSSSNPNFQNITGGEKSDIKKAFISRWGDKGRIVELDYGQLEIVVLAVLTQDPQLLEDIRSGTDIHTALYQQMYGKLPTKEERKAFKPRSFQLIYGAGAKAIAEQGNIPLSEAKEFIKVFYERYPDVKKWHDNILAEVPLERMNEGDKDVATGYPLGVSRMKGISGRIYTFKEYVNKYAAVTIGRKETSFSPSEIKNYFVQGTATGDIVPLVLGRLYRALHANSKLWNKCLLINTVHDSVLLDVHESVLEEAIVFCRNIMQDAPKYIKEAWNFDFNCSLKVGVSTGLNWLEQTEWDK